MIPASAFAAPDLTGFGERPETGWGMKNGALIGLSDTVLCVGSNPLG